MLQYHSRGENANKQIALRRYCVRPATPYSTITSTQSSFWGKDLVAFFDEIFRKRSRYCVVFVSEEYRDRKWTSHELRSAQARALEEKGQEYILPIKVDDIELDGLQPTIGYVPIARGIEMIADLLIKKLS
jgi:hypothetical protein